MVSLNDINGDESPKSSFADFKSGKEEYSIAVIHTQNSAFCFLESQFKFLKPEKDASWLFFDEEFIANILNSCEFHIKTKCGLQ